MRLARAAVRNASSFRFSLRWKAKNPGLAAGVLREVVRARLRSGSATLAAREPPSRPQGPHPHAMSQIAQHAERSAASSAGSRVRASPKTSLGSTTSYPWASTLRKSMTRQCSGIRAATSGKSRASLSRASPTISNDRSIARGVRRSSTNWPSVMSPSNATMSSAARIAT